ncbi:MAG TPA: DoxX family protein [Propionibacteriaceae bacterium]|nr:DoxX family protein [Propionibacteriaceae bacterium]
MSAFVRVVQDIVLLIARLAIGVILIAHGWARWQEQGIDAQIDYLTPSGIWEPTLLAWGATAFELIGGMLLIFGLGVPLLGLVMAMQNVLIIAWLRWNGGLYAGDGGFEYNLALAVVGLFFLAFGSGRAGLDALFRRKTPDNESLTIDDRSLA